MVRVSEAAAFLIRREAPSLSPEARLELVDRVSILSGQVADVLELLVRDPDPRVRERAVRVLRRLSMT